MKREEQILKRLTEQEGGLFYDTALRAMREFAKKDLLPPAEGAEEILEGVMVENGFTYVSFPAFVENESSIDVFDIACKAMTEFATLHAQRLAEKMVSERLRDELIDFLSYCNASNVATFGKYVIDEYLKSRER